MLTTAEIVRSTYGVWRLAHADPQGMSYFDATLEGFWRSFRVAVLLAPLYALMVVFKLELDPTEAALSRIVAVKAIAYALAWISYPLAAYYLVTVFDREREYVGYIVAYNWSSVLQIAVILPILAIAAGQLLPTIVAALLGITIQIALLVYLWYIAKTALGVGGFLAAAAVALDFVIGTLIDETANAMIY